MPNELPELGVAGSGRADREIASWPGLGAWPGIGTGGQAELWQFSGC